MPSGIQSTALEFKLETVRITHLRINNRKGTGLHINAVAQSRAIINSHTPALHSVLMIHGTAPSSISISQ